MRKKSLLTSVTSLRFLALAAALVVTAITLFSGHSSAQSKCGATGNESVSVDKTHYALGDTVRVSGSGFAPACALELQITAPDLSRNKESVTTDSDGQFDYSYVVTGPAGRWYNVDALGQDGPLGGTLFSAGPIVWTDQGDYLPGNTVTISGQGWKAGETVRLVIHDTSAQRMDRVLLAKADAEGAFANTDFTPEAQHLGVSFKLTASGLTSGYQAQNNFMDGPSFVKTIGTNTKSQFGNSSMFVEVPSEGIAAGNSIIVALQVGSFSGDVSCSDPINGDYHLDFITDPGTSRVGILSRHDVKTLGSGQKITCTYPGFSGNTLMSVNEFAGLAADPLDRVSSSSATQSGSRTSGLTETTTQTDELVFGLVLANDQSKPETFTVATANSVAGNEGTYDPPYTQIGKISGLVPYYRHPAAPALRKYELNGTVLNSGRNVLLVATYKAAAPSSGTLTVKHVVNNLHGGKKTESDFQVHVKNSGADVTDSPAAGSVAGKAYTLAAGSYEVSAEAVTGYTTSLSGDCDPSGNVTLTAGTSKACTITSTDVAPTLKVNKIVVPNGGLFNILIDGVQKAANVGNNGSTGEVEVNAGTRKVTETAGTNTLLSEYVTVYGGDCAADGTVSLELGDKKTCTSTSTKLAHIIVKTVTQPTGDPTSFDFSMSGGPTAVSNFSLTDGKEQDNKVVEGTYAVAQKPVIGYLTTSSCDPNVTVVPGETVTCVFTNLKDTDRDNIPDTLDCNPNVADDIVVDPKGVVPASFKGGRFNTLQEAVNASLDNSAISMYADTTENVVIGGGKDLRICGCGHKVTAANKALPVIKVESSAGKQDADSGKGEKDIHIDDVDVVGGATVGYHVMTSKVGSAGTSTILKSIRSTGHGVGIRIEGSGNQVRGADAVDSNTSIGLQVIGDSNVLQSNRVSLNGGNGIDVAGKNNQIDANKIGEVGKGNAGDGIRVVGPGNTISENDIFANGGDGIDVSGCTAASANVVVKNDVGDRGKGNLGNGILVAGVGSGTSNPIEISENTVKGNKLVGIKVTGTGHQLKNNTSGGSGAYASGGEKNGEYAFSVVTGNFNATGNKANGTTVAGANNSAFPTGNTGQ